MKNLENTCNKNNLNQGNGCFVVKPKKHLNSTKKPYYSRCIEFCSMAFWFTGFIFADFVCFTLFLCGLYFYLCAIYDLLIIAVGYHTGCKFRDTTKNYGFLWQFLLLSLFSAYVYYWRKDYGSENYGIHRKTFIRHLSVWNYMADYFPIQLVLSEELVNHMLIGRRNSLTLKQRDFKFDDLYPSINIGLSTDRNYLLGFHPHGILCPGAFVNFMTEATGFYQAFPGITPWLSILKEHFRFPFFRDILGHLGLIPATAKCLNHFLDDRQCKRTGNLIVVVVGGTPEMLDSHPGRYLVHLSYRFGFFRLALQNGASLIPCLSFGEQNIYNQVSNPPGSLIRRVQDWITKRLVMSPPIFYARGFLPYRKPITTVVGAPIDCERVENPSREQISAVKEKYIQSLTDLFRRYKPIYDPEANDIEFI